MIKIISKLKIPVIDIKTESSLEDIFLDIISERVKGELNSIKAIYINSKWQEH